MVKPKFVELSRTHTDVVFLSVDVEEVSEVAEKYAVSAMPTFKFIRYALLFSWPKPSCHSSFLHSFSIPACRPCSPVESSVAKCNPRDCAID